MFNSQFSILIRKEKRRRFRRECREVIPAKKHLAIRHPLRMRIEHWELSVGQIPGRIQGSGFCHVIFARALIVSESE